MPLGSIQHHWLKCSIAVTPPCLLSPYPREGKAGTAVPLPHQLSKPNYHSFPSLALPLNIQRTHRNEQTNKPRALLMQQALYNEPKRACLLWEDRTSVQSLRFFPLQNPSSPFHHSPWICTCPNSPSPFQTDSAQRYTWHNLASQPDSQVSVLCYSVDKGRHSDPAKNLGNNKTFSPSTSKVKYIPAGVSWST